MSGVEGEKRHDLQELLGKEKGPGENRDRVLTS